MKNNEPQIIQTIYDIIFGQRFFLTPMNFTEIKPIRLIGEVKALRAQYQSQRKTNGKRR